MSRGSVLVVLGVVAILVGALWVGQGLGLVPGSFMTGNQMWLWFGLALALFGLALLMAGLRQRPGRRDGPPPR